MAMIGEETGSTAGCDDPWSALMGAAQDGDERAYRRLLAELIPWLYRFFARRLPTASVEDAVQETLVAIHARRDSFRREQPFRPWLVTIARYKWVDRLRAMRHDLPVEAAEAVPQPSHGEAVTAALSVQRLLAQIKPAQAEVIRLVKLDGLSIVEASERTGQSQALVKVNIHRGLRHLQAHGQREAAVMA